MVTRTYGEPLARRVAEMVVARSAPSTGWRCGDRAGDGDRHRRLRRPRQHRRLATALQRRQLRGARHARPPRHAQPRYVRRPGALARRDRVGHRAIRRAPSPSASSSTARSTPSRGRPHRCSSPPGSSAWTSTRARAVDGVWLREGTRPIRGSDRSPCGARGQVRRARPARPAELVIGRRTAGRLHRARAISEDLFYEGPRGQRPRRRASSRSCTCRSHAAQAIAGPRAGQRCRSRARDGADRDLVAGAADRRRSPPPGIGATVSTRDEADAVRVLYEDIDNDQLFWNVLPGSSSSPPRSRPST